MRLNRVLFIFSILLLSTKLFGQESYTAPSDSTFLEWRNGKCFLKHKVEAQQTIYSICRYYRLTQGQIYAYNPRLRKTTLSLGSVVYIPLSLNVLQRYKGPNFDSTQYKPIFYRVQPSETLYRISKTYFQLPFTVLMERNGLENFNLEVNQALKIGWLNKRGLPDSLTHFTGLVGVLADENTKNLNLYNQHLGERYESKSSGTACWDKQMHLTDKAHLYIMTSVVPQGSVVRVENPMSKRYLYAKVVAPKPHNSSTHSAIAVLTPTVAKALGALDEKFYIRLYHY
jgi:LysM repeat protein